MTNEDFEPIRLNKYISHNTRYSRREADKLIEDGKIEINNKKVTDMGTKVSNEDIVKLNDKKIFNNPNKEYTVIVYNKKKGELVTKNDPRGRATIYDNISHKFRHFNPVGRLDYNSEGVLLLSDSIDVVNRLTNSSLDRTYKLKISGKITDDMISAMENGMNVEDATKGAHSHTKIFSMEFKPFVDFQIIKNDIKISKLKVIISEGKNRELRRFFGYFDTDIMDLKRVDFGGVSLNALPSGKHRFLTRQEYRDLRYFLKKQDDKTQ
ncbi:MAG: pseudouridine synthase [Campylobacteraceae bacterium 4484_166]|nr:MAG: pseudouridine synthase [Campylobacteraceae bacterium 4484_166]